METKDLTKEFREMLDKIFDESIPMENVYARMIRAINKGRYVGLNLLTRKIVIKIDCYNYLDVNSNNAFMHFRKMLEELGVVVMPDKETQIAILEYLYDNYNNSYPSETDDKDWKNRYFKAKKAEELTDAQLATNPPRALAKVMLEGWIVLSCLFGTLSEDILMDNEKHWFWQSKKYPEFVILKEWIDGSKVED